MKKAATLAALSLGLSALTAAPIQADVSRALGEAADAVAAAASRQGRAFGALFDGDKRIASPVQVSGASDAALKRLMTENLDFVRGAFQAQYAPTGWKKKHSGWDLDAEVAKAKAEIMAKDGITVRDYQRILRSVVLSAKDYHVSVGFHSTEVSSLPLKVLSAEGRYFIGWIDRSKLPEASFPFQEGDELVSLGGRKTAELVKEFKKALGGNTAGTDAAFAAQMLTRRRALVPGGAPKGPVTLTLRPRGSEKVFNHQLIWDHSPELVGDPGSSATLEPLAARPRRVPIPWRDNMLSPMARASGAGEAGNPHALGARVSFLPALGLKIWESAPDSTFHAYIYKSPADGRLLGCLRIPSYTPADPAKAVADFAAIVAKFEGATDGLVIDQVNNPGGSVFYLYALVSMLSEQAMTTPRHRIAISQGDVYEAAEFLALDGQVTDEDGAKAVLGESLGGYPVSYTLFRHILEFSRFIMAEWNAGRKLTDPVFLWGVDSINPSQTARYTKPILLLVNEMDFSGGDFFPAILQDNKRAVVFGTRTAGAGGFVKDVQFPNQLGVSNMTLTGSIAERANKNPIENLGVKPDIRYAPTAADLQGGFRDYARAVNAAMTGLLGKGAKPAGASR